jgi:chemotaxis response regulator CheB
MKTKSVVKDFPIVCVGGSAGGLDAYIRLLQQRNQTCPKEQYQVDV